MANVNIEKVVIGFLEANKSDDFAVFGDMPDPRPEGFVLVDRTGGPRDNIVQDRAELLIETYHKDSRQSASDEAYRIADIMEALLEIEAITHVKVNSVVKLDDLLGQYWRYQIYVDIFYRRGEIDGAINYPVVPPGTYVTSVNGKTGAVELDANDVGADAEGSAAAAEAAANLYTDEQLAALIDENFGDNPYDVIDLTNLIGGKFQVGDGPAYISGLNEALIYYSRSGRTVNALIAMGISADAVWPAGDAFFPIQLPTIYGRQLPFIPRIYPAMTVLGIPPAGVGNLALINTTDSDGSNGLGLAIGTVITDFGGALQDPGMVFFHAARITQAELTNLVFEGNQIDMVGKFITIYGRLTYEAAYEEGYLNIADNFPAGDQDTAYDESLQITISSGQQSPFTAEVIAGALPTGLDLDVNIATFPVADFLQLSGTPTAEGEYTFTVKLTGANGDEYQKEFTIVINPPYVPSNIDIQGDFTDTGNVDIPYSSTLNIVLEDEGQQLPISQAVIDGALPDGLALSIQNDTDLVLSGEPTSIGTFNFEVEITDTNGATNSKIFEIIISAYNPELEAQYLGTVSGNTLNINFTPAYGGGSQHIVDYVATPGDILKIRSNTFTYDFGEGPLNVPVNGFIIFEDGYWREYNYA